MIRWSITFFIIALIAAVFGFGGVAASAAGIGKFIFMMAVVLFVISIIAQTARRTG